MDSSSSEKKSLGAVLIENLIISKDEFKQALAKAKEEKTILAVILIDNNVVSEDDLIYLMINYFNQDHTPLDDLEIDEKVVETIPEDVLRKIYCLPFNLNEKTLSVAMLDPVSSEKIISSLESQLGLKIHTTVSMKSELDRAFVKYFEKPTEPEPIKLDTNFISGEDELLSELGQSIGIPQKKPETSTKLKVEEEKPGEVVLKPPEPADGKQVEFEKITSGSAIDPGETFDNFVAGKQNKFAFNLALNIAKAFNPSYNPFFIYSESGLGKTHLLNAIANYIEQKGIKRNFIYVTITDFEDEFSKSLVASTTVEFKEVFKQADMFLLDDIQLLGNKQDLQGEIFSIFNYYIQHRKQLVITSDVSPLELAWMDERLQSRLMSGVIVNIQSYDNETKMEIMKKEALINKVSIPGDVLEYLAGNSGQNIRKLKGAFKMLAAMNKLESKDITMDEAENVVRMMFPKKAGSTKSKGK